MKLCENFQINNSLKAIDELKVHLDRIADPWNLTGTQLFEINIVLEELCVNYIKHVAKNGDSPMEIGLCLDDSVFHISIIDHGPEFDPGSIAEPDISASLDERTPGGLGLHLVRYYADFITYKRKENANILHIEKHLT